MKGVIIFAGIGVALCIGFIIEVNVRYGAPKVPSPSYHVPYDPARTSGDVDFYTARVKRDPRSALDFVSLAGAYLERCRESGDVADAVRAESAAGNSIRIRTRRNDAAFLRLAQALMAQHRFHESLAAAEDALRVSASDPAVQRFKAEVLIETGDYTHAEAALHAISLTSESADDRLLRARFLQLNGQPDQAVSLLRAALADSENNPDLPVTHLAWIHTRLGDVLETIGRESEARNEYQESIRLFPRDYKAMFGLARLSADSGDAAGALEWAKRSAEIVPQPEVIALMADCEQLLGRSAESEKDRRLIESMAKLSRAQGVVYDRQRALYLADHRLNTEEAMALARRELKERRDVYALDTLAWTAYRMSRIPEADAAMKAALSRHTIDSRMFLHAALIARAAGRMQEADLLFHRADSIWPRSIQPAARETRDVMAHSLTQPPGQTESGKG